MSEVIELIKKIALNTLRQSQPVEIMFGAVLSVSPLEIRRDQKVTLGEAQLIQTERLAGNVEAGDVVILIKEQGGQRYLMVDKVVT